MLSQARQLRKKDAKTTVVKQRVLRRFFNRIKIKPRQIAELVPAKIVKGLNEHPTSPAAKRVSRFIHLFNHARNLNDSFRLFFESKEDMMRCLHHSPGSAMSPLPAMTYSVALTDERKNIFGTGLTFKNPEMQALNDQLNRVLMELNKLGRRYRWHPIIRHMGYEMEAFDVTECWDVKDANSEWETHAIWWLCGKKGKWIDLFRQCRDCSRWFFALAEHQSYCGNSCRKRHASVSEEFKEKRRLYMRAYRRLEKERERRAKTLARIPKNT
jgi:hypothetical protein